MPAHLNAFFGYVDSSAKHRSAPGCGVGHAKQHLDGGGFARAVAAEKARNLAACNLKVQRAHGLHLFKPLRQAPSFNNACSAHSSPLLCGRRREDFSFKKAMDL